jgi:hypothetical protein
MSMCALSARIVSRIRIAGRPLPRRCRLTLCIECLIVNVAYVNVAQMLRDPVDVLGTRRLEVAGNRSFGR